MKIKCYRTTSFKATDTYEVTRINGVLDVDEMDDEEREIIKENGEVMFGFTTKDGACYFVPACFIISITD